MLGPNRPTGADREISEHYTAAVGGRAQSYEPSPSGGTTAPEEMILAPWRSRQRARYVVVEAMLSEVSSDTRRILRTVYAHGTDAFSDDTDEDGRPLAGKPSGLVVGRNNSPDPLGLLRVALTPTWGHGSYLRLAVGQDRALRAFAKRYPSSSATSDVVQVFLADEAGRGDAAARMLAEIRDECEEVRDGALRSFEAIRKRHRERVDAAERQARDEEVAAAERTRQRARESSRRIPACLQMSDEQRERLRAAALAMIAQLEEPELEPT